VVAIGIGEGVKRNLLRGARQEIGHAGHFADEDRVPAFQELLVRDIDPARGLHLGEIFDRLDLPSSWRR
jgi:hypothetical protein